MAGKLGIFGRFWGAAILVAALGLAPAPAGAAPAVGDTYTYVLRNGYNGEVRGNIRLEVTGTAPGAVTYSFNPDKAAAGWHHTVVMTPEGNWLRHMVESHGQKIEYRFTTPYPAYVFPLTPDKAWSVRVKARVADDPRLRNVRVDAKVIGTERVRVPAGEFEAIKVKRHAYSGDEAFMLSETHVTETDWYVPALGRSVRTERSSVYLDMNTCGPLARCETRGDWDIYELAEVRAAKP